MGAKWNCWSEFYRVLAEANVDWHYPSFSISTEVWSVFISTQEERCSGNLDLCFLWLKQTDDSQTDRLIERAKDSQSVSQVSCLEVLFQQQVLNRCHDWIYWERRINLVNLATYFLIRDSTKMFLKSSSFLSRDFFSGLKVAQQSENNWENVAKNIDPINKTTFYQSH